MRVLWLCNIILPAAAKQMGVEASSKEGWLSGLADVVLANQKKNGIELSVAFPMGNIHTDMAGEGIHRGQAALGH